MTVLEKEKGDLERPLNDEKEDAAGARTDAEHARAEAQAAHKRDADQEREVKNMRGYHEKTESATRAGVDRVHILFVDAYRDLGVQTAPFDKSGEEVGTCFLRWLQEELVSLPSIVMGLMSYVSLMSCEGLRMPCPTRDVGTSRPLIESTRTAMLVCSKSNMTC